MGPSSAGASEGVVEEAAGKGFVTSFPAEGSADDVAADEEDEEEKEEKEAEAEALYFAKSAPPAAPRPPITVFTPIPPMATPATMAALRLELMAAAMAATPD